MWEVSGVDLSGIAPGNEISIRLCGRLRGGAGHNRVRM